MKLSTFTFSLLAALVVPVRSDFRTAGSDTCNGTKEPDLITKLNFVGSEVVTNTLHEEGGELRYSNVGVFDNQNLDLVVTIESGSYTDIEQVWIDRGKPVPNQSGLNGAFAQINLQTVEGIPKSGEGNFKTCVVKQGTNDPVVLEQFTVTVFDLDERGTSGMKEKLLIDTTQAQTFVLASDTEIVQSCEDGSEVPCPGGVRTVFCSTKSGTLADNPTDPAKLTSTQKRRSVSFTFQDTGCWYYTYDHFCEVDQPEYEGTRTKCSNYAGGNFLFAGESKELIKEGECLTPAPTASPSRSPSGTPTQSPTDLPSTSPSEEPTMEPSSTPTKSPTESPSSGPTPSPTPGPSSGPTESPTPSPTKDPTPSPTLSPSEGPTTSPTPGPTSEPSDSPSESPSGSFYPSSTPTNPPTVSPAPSAGPTGAPTPSPSAGPTTEPTPSPSSGPTASPTPGPSSGPTPSPTPAPTSEPTPSPSSEPTAEPTGSPSGSPTTVPTPSPSKSLSPSNGPTEGPTPSPSQNPTCDDSVTVPTLPPATCPEDVDLFATEGVTGVDINQAVEVLEQNTTHVTVRLYNRWSSCGEVDSIYNQFKKGHFEEVCYEATDVPGGSAYDDLTLQCFHLKPYAQLETCVVDDNGALDPVGDDATVPECCYANTEDKPVVCYKILINCETGCTELVDRRNLRGGV